MKVNYYEDTDSMYIDLSEKPSADSQEIAKGIVLDFDQDGKLVGIDIDTASSNVNLARVLLKSFPGRVETV